MKRTVLDFEQTVTYQFRLILDKEYTDEDLEFLEYFERLEDPDSIDDYKLALEEHHIKVVKQIGDLHDPDDWGIEWTDTFNKEVEDE